MSKQKLIKKMGKSGDSASEMEDFDNSKARTPTVLRGVYKGT